MNDKSPPVTWGRKSRGKLSLEPGNQHLDRIAQLSVPVSQPGWYLLTVTLNNGYRFHRLLSLSDLVLIRRSIPEGNLWFLAQAKTGVPVEGGKISLVRYRENKTLQTKQVKGTTDKNGVLVETLPPNDSNSPTYYNLLGIATHGDSYVVTGGRKEWYSGESRMSLNNKVSSSYGCFFLESQPVYRAGPNGPVQRGPVPSGFRQSRYKRLCRKKIDADDPQSHRRQGNFPGTNSYYGRHGRL